MLKLPDVTLVLIETRMHEMALEALAECERRVAFGDVLVFTDRPAMFIRADRRVNAVPDWPSKLGWSRWFWSGVSPFMTTSHALGIQWDSWVVDTTQWTDEYLRYDYVGAPWWYKDGMNVGNGGFCLRSAALMRYLRANLADYPCTVDLDDDLLCRKYRPRLESAGFRWAPEDLAGRFAFETLRPAPDSKHFGFHAAYNFDFGCEGDSEKLLAKARHLAKSQYATGSNRYIWEGFAKKCPDIAARVREAFDGRESEVSAPGGS